MIVFSLDSSNPFISELNKMIEWVRDSDVPSKVSGDSSKEDLSEQGLKDIINGKINTCRMSRFDKHPGYDFRLIDNYANELYKERTENNFIQVPVAKTWYPEKEGYLGWHIDRDGDRLYITYAFGKSFFRYKDPKTGEIITSWDVPNSWTFRLFNFDKNNPTWHCVKSYDLRISIGYKFTFASI